MLQSHVAIHLTFNPKNNARFNVTDAYKTVEQSKKFGKKKGNRRKHSKQLGVYKFVLH